MNKLHKVQEENLNPHTHTKLISVSTVAVTLMCLGPVTKLHYLTLTHASIHTHKHANRRTQHFYSVALQGKAQQFDLLPMATSAL